MAFLLKATRESRGKKKLKHIIILTCRALAIAALVMAVARPLVSGLMGWGGGKLDTVIVVLDRSASMEQQLEGSEVTKRQSILNKIKLSMEDLGNPKLIIIDSATGIPTSIASPDILDDISQTAATDTQADIPNLIESAVNYVLEKNTGRTEIWVASDLRQADWQTNSSRWDTVRAGLKNASDQVSLKILAQKSAPNDNLSVRVLAAVRRGDNLVLDFEITNSSESVPANTEVPLNISLNGTERSETFKLTGQTMQVTKRFPLANKAGFGFLTLPSDTNPRDNTAFFAYGTDIPAHTAIVAPAGEARDSFDMAAAPPGYGNSKATSYTANQLDSIPWNNISLIVWQDTLPSESKQKRLLNYIDQGGVVVFFPPMADSEQSFLDLSWGPLAKSPRGKYFIIEGWDRSDGPLRNGDEGTPVAVDKLKAIKRRPVIGANTSLASWENGSAFLTRKIHGRGSAFFVSSLPDYSWSNLADADVFIPLMRRLVNKGNARFGSGYATTVGHSSTSSDNPDGRMVRVDTATESNPINLQYEAGVYTLGERTLATNRPVEEDSIQLASEQEVDAALGAENYRLFDDSGDSKEGLAQNIWPALLIASLIFLIIEALLCLAPRRQTIEAIK